MIPSIFERAQSTKGKQYTAPCLICINADGKYADIAIDPAAMHVLCQAGETIPKDLADEIGAPEPAEETPADLPKE